MPMGQRRPAFDLPTALNGLGLARQGEHVQQMKVAVPQGRFWTSQGDPGVGALGREALAAGTFVRAWRAQKLRCWRWRDAGCCLPDGEWLSFYWKLTLGLFSLSPGPLLPKDLFWEACFAEEARSRSPTQVCLLGSLGTCAMHRMPVGGTLDAFLGAAWGIACRSFRPGSSAMHWAELTCDRGKTDVSFE